MRGRVVRSLWPISSCEHVVIGYQQLERLRPKILRLTPTAMVSTRPNKCKQTIKWKQHEAVSFIRIFADNKKGHVELARGIQNHLSRLNNSSDDNPQKAQIVIICRK